MDRNKLKTSIRQAIENEGSLPVRWDCGGDDQALAFGGWGEDSWQRKHPYHESLSDLRAHLIQLMQLPYTGSISDEGEGLIDVSAFDSTIILTHTSTQIQHIEEAPEGPFSDYPKYEATVITELDLPDFSELIVSSSPIDHPEGRKTRRELLQDLQHCKDKSNSDTLAQFNILQRRLEKILEPLLESMEQKPVTDTLLVTSFSTKLEWSNETKTLLVHEASPQFAKLGRLSDDETVTLFD